MLLCHIKYGVTEKYFFLTKIKKWKLEIKKLFLYSNKIDTNFLK